MWMVVSWRGDAAPTVAEPVVDAALVESFDAFYGRELPAVVAVVYALTGNRWVAEDLANDAFVATYRRWAKVSAYDRPGAFVRRVAINLAASWRRRLAAEAKALARLATARPTVVGQLDPPATEFWAQVRRLPRRQAQAVALHYVEDLAVDQIAEILGVAPATVRVHLHRARVELAAHLGESLEDDR